MSTCKRNTFLEYEKQSSDIINPYYLKCINIKCQTKKNKRNNSFLKFAKSTPAAMVNEMVSLFLMEKK